MFSCQNLFSKLTGPKCIFPCVVIHKIFLELKRGFSYSESFRITTLMISKHNVVLFSHFFQLGRVLSSGVFFWDSVEKIWWKTCVLFKGDIWNGLHEELLQIRVRLGKRILGKQSDTLDRKRHSGEGEQPGFLFRCASFTSYILHSKCIKWTIHVRQRAKYSFSENSHLTEHFNTEFNKKHKFLARNVCTLLHLGT